MAGWVPESTLRIGAFVEKMGGADAENKLLSSAIALW
jgi:hypothetical protein